MVRQKMHPDTLWLLDGDRLGLGCDLIGRVRRFKNLVLCSSSSIFPGPFVHRLVVGLHTDFALHLDWFDCRDSDLVTKVRPDLSFDCGVGLQDYPEQLCLLLPTLYPLCSVPGFARIN